MALTDIDAQRLGDSVGDKLGNRNLIINGAMQVAQRGTSSASSGYQTVDRFKTLATTIVCTQSQQSLTSGDPYDAGFRYFYRQNNDTTSTAAGARHLVQTIFEAQDISGSGWDYTSASSYVTLSFWARSSVAQTFYGQIKTEDGTAQNYPFSFALSASTWTKVTKQIPGNANLQFDNNNAAGLEIDIVQFYGTNFTDSGVSVDAWAAYASGSRTPDNTSTWANTTNATFDITGVQLEVGNTATPFEHRSYGDELARCQRYYEVVRYNSATYAFMSGALSSLANQWETAYYKQQKRAAPTFTLESGAWVNVTPTIYPGIDNTMFSGTAYFYASGTSGNVAGSFNAEL